MEQTRRKRGPTVKPRIQDARVRAVFNTAMEAIAKGEKPNMFQIQRECGYSVGSAKSYQALQTVSWQRCLAEIRDDKLLNRLDAIAMEGQDHNSIKAIRSLLELKGRFPKPDRGTVTFTKKIRMLEEDGE